LGRRDRLFRRHGDRRRDPEARRRGYRRIRNTLRFLIANTADFDPHPMRSHIGDLFEIDRFALLQAHAFADAVQGHYANYDFHFVVQRLQTYLLRRARRVLSRHSQGPSLHVRERGSRTSLGANGARAHRDALLKLMAPILSFTAEEAWKVVHPDDPTIFTHLWERSLPDVADAALLFTKWDRDRRVRALVQKELEGRAPVRPHRLVAAGGSDDRCARGGLRSAGVAR
jgi:isoleucyl-tRNA synthetase